MTALFFNLTFFFFCIPSSILKYQSMMHCVYRNKPTISLPKKVICQSQCLDPEEKETQMKGILNNA